VRRLVFAFVLAACAHSPEARFERAYIVGASSKDVVDGLYGGWDKAANERVAACVAKLPPAEHTKAEYDACVGPFNEKNQELAVSLLEGVRAAQLALFIALTEGGDTEGAVADLIAAAMKLRKFVEETR